jgi:hypothetical protein
MNFLLKNSDTRRDPFACHFDGSQALTPVGRDVSLRVSKHFGKGTLQMMSSLLLSR